MSVPARTRAQAIAARRSGGHTLAVPIALRLAARISERPWESFLTDPTQLANGLIDLWSAVPADGIVLTVPDVLAEDPDRARRDCAVEATRRLRATVREDAALVALLPGAAEDLLDTVRALLDAGIDGVVLAGACPPGSVRTIGNVTRFHRAMAHGLAAADGLPAVTVAPLTTPGPGTGLVLTDGEVPPDTAIPTLAAWVAAVHAGPS